MCCGAGRRLPRLRGFRDRRRGEVNREMWMNSARCRLADVVRLLEAFKHNVVHPFLADLDLRGHLGIHQ